jgi:hypothetical protein
MLRDWNSAAAAAAAAAVVDRHRTAANLRLDLHVRCSSCVPKVCDELDVTVPISRSRDRRRRC